MKRRLSKMRILFKAVSINLSILVIISTTLLINCGNDNNDKKSTEAENAEDVIIVIGNLTDRTGPAAQSMQYIDLALEDSIRYYNDNDLIPGVKLKLEEYDTQYDTARVMLGYNFLKDKGASVIVSFLPIVPEIVSYHVNKDEIVFFTANANAEYLYPPGYTFAWSCLWDETAYTQLKWIAENHWNYQLYGPARLGGAGWDDGAAPIVFEAAKSYAAEHPDQFEWVDGYITDFTFSWASQIEALKDCDYIFIPTVMHTFTREYVNAGYSKATFLANESHTAFLGMMSESERWDDIEGTLFVMNLQWWGQGAEEEVPIVDELLNTYHPDRVNQIKSAGRSYITAFLHPMLCDIIKIAAADVGPEHVNSTAIYEAAQTFQYDLPSVANYLNFGPEKRNGYNYFMISEADADEETLKGVSGWLPVIHRN